MGTKGRLLTAAALAAGAAWALRDVPMAVGARPAGDRAERVGRSPQFRDGKFRNTVPSGTVAAANGGRMFRENVRGHLRFLAKHRGIPYAEVARTVHGSTATVTRVAHWLRHGEGGYRLVLDRRGRSTRRP